MLETLKSPWIWLTQVDPRPGLTAPKVLRLTVKSFLFALLVTVLISLLRALGVPYMETLWGQLIVMLIVYVPFVRFLTAEMTPPDRALRSGRFAGKSGTVSKAKRAKRVKYAGVKRGGPKFR
nr:hypothetical protein [Deinobacterium chartae]